jgi:hypothetical protein
VKTLPVGAAEGCGLLIFSMAANPEDPKIAAFGSSYTDCDHPVTFSLPM